MREATLNGLSDLDAVRPRKPRQPAIKGGKGGKSAKAQTLGARLQRFRGRATLVVGSAGFAAIMVGIVCNAMILQKGHHPAPLFGTASEGEPARQVPHADPVAAVAPAPAPVRPMDAAASVAAPVGPAAPVAAPMHRATHVATTHGAVHPTIHAPAPAHRVAKATVPVPAHRSADAIARLLGSAAGAPMTLHPAVRVRPGQSMVARAVVPVKAAAKKLKPDAVAAKSGELIPD